MSRVAALARLPRRPCYPGITSCSAAQYNRLQRAWRGHVSLDLVSTSVAVRGGSRYHDNGVDDPASCCNDNYHNVIQVWLKWPIITEMHA